jgi:CelD/BcsL family acetyltransferase involved in cellulose biosynthesis
LSSGSGGHAAKLEIDVDGCGERTFLAPPVGSGPLAADQPQVGDMVARHGPDEIPTAQSARPARQSSKGMESYPDCHTHSSRCTNDDSSLTARRFEHRVYRSFEDAAEVRDAWDSLAAVEADLLCSFDWCALWWRHHGQGRRLEIHVFSKGEEIVAVAPLFRETFRIGLARIRAVRIVGCDHSINTCNIAIRPAFAREVLSALVNAVTRSGWDVIHLGRFPGYFQYADLIEQYLTAHPGISFVERIRDPLPHALLNLPRTFDEYLQGLSSRERQNIRKENRRLVREHGMVSVDASALDGPAAAIGQFIEFHQQQWVCKGHRGHFDDWPKARVFHRDVAVAEANGDRLVLRRIEADGQPLSMEYAVRFGQRLHWFLSARSLDSRWHFCFPGRVGAIDLVELSIAGGIRQIELGSGFYPYKLKLGGGYFPSATIVAVRKGRWRALKVAVLRSCSLVHEVLGRRLWYERLSSYVPVLRVSIYSGYIRTRMWPADGARARVLWQKVIATPGSWVVRLVRLVREIRCLGDVYRCGQHQINTNFRRKSRVFAVDRPTALRTWPASPGGFGLKRYRFFQELEDDDKAFIAQHSGSLVLLRLEEDLLRGGELWISRIDGNLAGVAVAARGKDVGPYFLPLNSRDVVIRKCLSIGGSQSGGVLTAILRHMIRDLASEGVDRIFIDGKAWDTPSLEQIAQAGFKELGIATMRRRLTRWVVTWHSWDGRGR